MGSYQRNNAVKPQGIQGKKDLRGHSCTINTVKCRKYRDVPVSSYGV